jgi:hypothetical protein
LSLYELLDREGAPKYVSREEVAKNFRIKTDAALIISGIQVDKLLERLWNSTHREAVFSLLRSLKVNLVTSPNFSVYNNVPRSENLYNIKRILLFAQELLSQGIPTALHINACTDVDYERYASFLSERPEFEAISFEFITGPGYPSRMPWHIRKLIELRNRVNRPLQLILRGGTRTLGALSSVYPHLILIDSDPLQRALHRQRMIFGNDGHIRVVRHLLPEGRPVDELFALNAEAARMEVEFAIRHPRLTRGMRKAIRRMNALSDAANANQKSGQLDLLTDPSHRQSRTNSLNRESVVSTPKSERAT